MLSLLDKIVALLNWIAELLSRQAVQRDNQQHQQAVEKVEQNPAKAMSDHFSGDKGKL